MPHLTRSAEVSDCGIRFVSQNSQFARISMKLLGQTAPETVRLRARCSQERTPAGSPGPSILVYLLALMSGPRHAFLPLKCDSRRFSRTSATR